MMIFNFQLLTPLISDKPNLNLFNAKDSPTFSMEIKVNSMNNVKLVNPNFNLVSYLTKNIDKLSRIRPYFKK